MAGKKISKNAVMDRGVTKVHPGTPVRLISMGDASFTCPTCGRTMRNQIAFRVDGAEHCSRLCAARAAGAAE